MNLPKGLTLPLMQTKWAGILNPLIGNPSLATRILPNQPLINGSNVINHGLGKALTGWRIVRLRASASVFDTQDSNPKPELTLLLTSSAAVVADIEVF